MTFKEEINKVYLQALELAKNKRDQEHYYHVDDGKFVSIHKDELDRYFEGDDELDADDYIDEIVYSTEYVRVPNYYKDDETFSKDFAFNFDYCNAFRIEATDEVLKDLYEYLYIIYKLKPFNYFRDVDYIKNEINNDNLEDCYYCVLGKAGKVYGLSLYLGESGLESLHGICDGNANEPNLTTFYAFTQNCLTFYFDKPSLSDPDSRFLTRKYIGNKADEVVISTLHFNGRFSTSNFIRYSTAMIYMPYIEAFKFFLEKYVNDGIKYKKFKYGEHVVFEFNDENNEITYRKKLLEDPIFHFNGDFLDDVPLMHHEARKTSKIYEFKFTCIKDIFHSDDGVESYYAPVVILANHKTGKVIGINIVISDDRDYLYSLFEPIEDALLDEGLPKKIIVDSYLDAIIAERFFPHETKIDFGTLDIIDQVKEEIEKAAATEDGPINA